MLDCFKCIDFKKTGIFAAGVLFGTAGIKVLSSKDAKKVYTNCTAAVLRAKDCVMKPDITAPGTNILSCYSASHYIERSGTSMATPIVSGAIALYLEKHPASTNKMIKLKLRTSCDDLGLPHNQQGWGRINIQKLLQN